jgi:hypothetical protein
MLQRCTRRSIATSRDRARSASAFGPRSSDFVSCPHGDEKKEAVIEHRAAICFESLSQLIARDEAPDWGAMVNVLT